MIVVGAEGEVEDVDTFIEKIKRLSEEKGIEIQVVDADLVCGKDHLLSAYQHAVRAFEEKRNSMKRISMEILLYLSGERQISDAIKKMGVKKDSQKLVFIFLDSKDHDELKGKISEDEVRKIVEEMGMEIKEDVMEPSREKLRMLGFSEEEIDTVDKDKYEDLVLEKVAMVDIIK